MSIIRWEPFRRIPSLQREMEKAWADMVEPWSFVQSSVSMPSIDLAETESEVVVKADLPGMSDKEIEVTISDNVLSIKGEKRAEKEEKGKRFHRVERSYGSFFRSVALPAHVDQEKASAKFENGVLEIKIPKSEEAKPKKVEIN